MSESKKGFYVESIDTEIINTPHFEPSKLLIDRIGALYKAESEEEAEKISIFYDTKMQTELEKSEEAQELFSYFKNLEVQLGATINNYIQEWQHANFLLSIYGMFIEDNIIQDVDTADLKAFKTEIAIRQGHSLFIESIVKKVINMAFFKHYLMALKENYKFEKLDGIIDDIDDTIKGFKSNVKLFNKIVHDKDNKNIPTISIKKEMYKKDYDNLLRDVGVITIATRHYYNLYNKYTPKINIWYGLG